MPDPLNYYRPPVPPGRAVHAGPARAARILSVFSLICFVIPFGLVTASQFMPRDQAELIAYVVLMPSLVLWLAAGLLALAGSAMGIVALYQGRASPWTIACTAASFLVLVISMVAVADGIRRTIRNS